MVLQAVVMIVAVVVVVCCCCCCAAAAGSTNLNIRRVAHLPYLAPLYYVDKALAAHY